MDALRGVAVNAAEWRDAFGVITRGRVQLKLRDGEPGPVLGRDAGFWAPRRGPFGELTVLDLFTCCRSGLCRLLATERELLS